MKVQRPLPVLNTNAIQTISNGSEVMLAVGIIGGMRTFLTPSALTFGLILLPIHIMEVLFPVTSLPWFYYLLLLIFKKKAQVRLITIAMPVKLPSKSVRQTDFFLKKA